MSDKVVNRLEKRFEYITPEDFETAEQNGLSMKLVRERVYNLGWDIDKAISTPKRKIKKDPLWAKWRKVASENGVSYQLYSKRVKEWGIDPEVAASTKPMKFDEIHQLAMKAIRKYDPKLLEIAAKNGISKKLFYRRVSGHKWDIERAITTPPMSRQEVAVLGNKKATEKRRKRMAEDPNYRPWNDIFFSVMRKRIDHYSALKRAREEAKNATQEEK